MAMTAQADHDKELPKMMTIREIAATDILPEYATSISKNNPRISPLNLNYFGKRWIYNLSATGKENSDLKGKLQ